MKRLLLLVSLLAMSTIALAAETNINSASQAQLAALPQLGTVKAQAIVAYRTTNGCFKSMSDLLRVTGVTQADIDAIKGVVVIGTCTQMGTKSKAQT